MTIELPHEEHPVATIEHPAITEQGNLTVAHTTMANSTAMAANTLNQRFQQLGADAAAMWSIAMTTPTFTNAQAMRSVNESGSGRTRVESNTPADTQTVGGAQ